MSSTTPPSDRLLAGRYALHERVEQGSVGAVVRATDTMLRREVAVKEVDLHQPGPRAGRAGLQERLLREVRAAARVVHQGIVTVFDVVSSDGSLYLVTELVPGGTLRDLVASEGPLPPDRVARLGATLLAALSAAHRRGLVHHDVQPGNVLVMPDGRVKLCDLGIAFLRPGPAVGGVEAVEGEGQDADLRALGATLRFAAGVPGGRLGRVIEALLAAGPERPVPIAAIQDALDQLGAAQHAATQHAAAEREVPQPAPVPPVVPPAAGAAGGTGPERPAPAWVAPNAPAGPDGGVPGPRRAAAPVGAGSGAREPASGWRARAWWVPATLLVAACVVVAAVALGRTTGAPPAAPAQGQAPARPATERAAPPGWQPFEDAQSGFGVAIPPGWALVQDRTGGLAFRDEGTGSTVRIQHTDAPAPQPDDEPRRSERTYLATGPYKRIRLDATTFRGQPAAEWEFTFTRAGVDWHAEDLYFIAGGRGYWLSFQTPADRWAASGPMRAALRDSFRLLTESAP